MIRPAQPEDAPQLARLRYEFRASIRNQHIALEEPATFLLRCESWMREALQSDQWFCWIAETDGAAIGCIWLHLFAKIPNPWPAEREHNGYITSFYVKPEARGQGLGRELLNAALQLDAARNADSIVLWATQESRPLYERAGFAVPVRIMELVSGQPGHA